MVLRKCSACGETKERSELIRILRLNTTGELIIMPTSKHFGRSSYLCYNKDCLKLAIKKRRLQKTLKKDIPDTLFEKLEKIIN